MATLLDLRESARSKADEASTGFITNTELDRFLNQGLRLIYGKILQRFEDYYIVKGTTLNSGKFSTTSGTHEYSLPSTLQKLVRVEYADSNETDEDSWVKIPRLNIGSDRVDPYYPLREGYLAEFGYFLAGQKIYLKPCPTQVFDVRLWFIPRVTALSLTTDVPGIPEEYHELIAEYGSIQCLRKSGESIWRESMDLFQLELQNLLETIETRDQSPEQMVITEEWERD